MISVLWRLASVGLGVLLFVFFGSYSFDGARDYARDNSDYTKRFVSASVAMNEYRKQTGAYPPTDFLRASKVGSFQIYYARPLDSSFDFPEWTKQDSYAIGSWNGDDMEWFDSESGQSTTGRKDTQWEVIRTLVPQFLIATGFILLPVLVSVGKRWNRRAR